MSVADPVLWHIPISHYSEKARWALDYKRMPHRRRALPGGFHMVAAMAVTRGESFTFPVLVLDGEAIGDSTAIIGALEQRRPEPSLYPDDPSERRRALDLEDYFDEEVAPATRLLGWNAFVGDPDRLGELVQQFIPSSVRGTELATGLTVRFATAFTGLRYGVRSEEGAERARTNLLVALDRLEDELDGNEYLVGDRFSVADLTAAAALYPLVLPPEAPSLGDPPEPLAGFRAPLAQRPAFKWVERTYARHRRTANTAARPVMA